MSKNIGTIDRIIRAIIGVVIIGIGIYYKSWWGLLGIIPLLTAAFAYCPPYALLGINTCKKQ